MEYLKEYIDRTVKLILESGGQTTAEDLEDDAENPNNDPKTALLIMKSKCSSMNTYNHFIKNLGSKRPFTDGEIEYLNWLGAKIHLFSEEPNDYSYTIEDLEYDDIYIVSDDYGQMNTKQLKEIDCYQDEIVFNGEEVYKVFTDSPRKIIEIVEQAYLELAEEYEA